jgi:hypothetical protein
MESVINEHQQQALDTFGFRAAVPLFCAIGEDADHLATGTFIAVGEKCILLTARHILDTCEPERIAIATSPKGSGLQTLGNLVVHKPIDLPGTEIDVVGIEILDRETIDIIKAGWRVVDMATGGEADASGELVLIGYPSATLNKKDMQIVGRPIGIVTALMDDVPANATPPVDPTLDLFLQLTWKAIATAGAIVDIPPIHGMSGCAIWQLREIADGEFWSPDRALRLVGVQSTARSGSYFRGKRWAYIRNLLEQVV